MDLVTLLLAARRAKIGASQDSGRDSKDSALYLHLSISDFLKKSSLAGSSLKTCQVCSLAITEPISKSSCRKWTNSGILAHGRCWIASFSPWRRGGGVCFLSDILETGAIPHRYYLSPTACRGILRRADKRGKEIPPALRKALETVAYRAPSVHQEQD